MVCAQKYVKTNKNSTKYVAALYNDVWKYNISSNQWAWMEGNATCFVPPSTSTFTVNTTGSSLAPIARAGANVWADSNYIWFYGGQCAIAGVNGKHLFFDFLQQVCTFPISGNST
jgi:hypothetical protein